MLATEKKSASIQQPLVMHTEGMVPLKLINVTGSKMRQTRKVRTPSDNEEEPEGYEPVPSFRKAFGEALAQKLEQVDKADKKIGEYSMLRFFILKLKEKIFVIYFLFTCYSHLQFYLFSFPEQASSGKKKKKTVQKLLFTTTMAYSTK